MPRSARYDELRQWHGDPDQASRLEDFVAKRVERLRSEVASQAFEIGAEFPALSEDLIAVTLADGVRQLRIDVSAAARAAGQAHAGVSVALHREPMSHPSRLLGPGYETEVARLVKR